MKIMIETGSESRTTSSASVQAHFVTGEYKGQFLYQQKQFQVGKPTWDSGWVTTTYDLPEGTKIAVVGKGRTGPRGVNEHAFHRVYRLDPAAEVVEVFVDVGLRSCTLKGRLVLTRDVLAALEKANKINTEEGF